jgi:hypothetical protein
VSFAILVAPAEHIPEFPSISRLYNNNSTIGLSFWVVFSFVIVVSLLAQGVYEKIPVFVMSGGVVHIIFRFFTEIHRS